MTARNVDAAFDREAREICAAREQWWGRLRAFNREGGMKTGAQADAVMQTSAELDARVEALRRRYFPRAHRLVVQNGKAITVSATARAVRRVWTAALIDTL